MATFPPTYYYDDTWYIDAIAENQQVFVTDFFDLVTKSVPALSVLLSLLAVRGCFVLRLSPTVCNALKDAPTADSVRKKSSNTLVQIRSSGVKADKIGNSLAEMRFHRTFNNCFVLWGLFVAIVHIHATVVARISANPGCYLNLRPCFSNTYYCAVFEVNCESRTSGTNLKNALQSFDHRRLRALIFSGCSELNVPSTLQYLPQLEMLKIYNSSISSWPIDAALTGSNHPQLALLYIVRTNFSHGKLPDGLLSDDFPPTLQDIEFCVTNLEDLPRELRVRWKSIGFFSLEATPPIQEIPSALSDLRVLRLSLSSNNISSIPDQIFSQQAFGSLSLSGNPLVKLPETIGSLNFLYRTRLEFSGLTSLPTWMLRESSVVAAQDTYSKVVDVQLSGSPVYEHWANQSTSTYFAVGCSPAQRQTLHVVYPLAFEDALRSSRRARLIEQM